MQCALLVYKMMACHLIAEYHVFHQMFSYIASTFISLDLHCTDCVSAKALRDASTIWKAQACAELRAFAESAVLLRI